MILVQAIVEEDGGRAKNMTDDDLVAKYAAEAKAAMSAEASRRIDELTDPIVEERLRTTSLIEFIGGK